MLDQQPLGAFVAGLARADMNQREAAFQLVAIEAKLEVALGEHGMRIAFRLPGADVPDHHRARAIVARRE